MQKNKGGGKPFRSKLEPYFEVISSARRQRQTWVEISLELTNKYGVDCTAQGVHSFFKTRVKGRLPLGFQPTPISPAALTDAAPPANSIGEKYQRDIRTRKPKAQKPLFSDDQIIR